MRKDESKLLKTTTVLFGLNILASALNYICQLVMARVLSVESYGTVNTIFSFMLIIAVPGTTLTMIVAKYYASDNRLFGNRFFLKKQIMNVIILTGAISVILLILSGYLSRILSISDKYVLIFAILLASFGFFQPLYSGVFSGNRCYILVGIYSLFIPLYKIIAIIIAYVYTLNDILRLYVVLTLMFIGVVITAVYGHIKSYSLLHKEETNIHSDGTLYSRDDLHTLFLNLSIMLYMNIDVLVVRYYGNETESGLYGAALLFGRIIYYFATTMGTILLPSVANVSSTNAEKMKIFNKAIILMILFAGSCMIPINLMKTVLIGILYGENYTNATKYVFVVSLISLSLSIYTIMVNYVVGVGRTKKPTIIMLGVDIVLIIAANIVSDLNMLLYIIATIGLLGSIFIYMLERCDYVNLEI